MQQGVSPPTHTDGHKPLFLATGGDTLENHTDGQKPFLLATGGDTPENHTDSEIFL